MTVDGGSVVRLSGPAGAGERSASRTLPGSVGLLAAHVRFALLLLGSLAASRVLLMILWSERIPSAGTVRTVLLSGLRMDVVAICYALAPAVLVALIAGGRHRVGRLTSVALRVYFVGMTVAFLFMEIVTPAFVAEYDSRPNRLFVEYLVHPREVSSMLIKGYLGSLVIASVLTAIVAVVAWRLFASVVAPTRSTGPLRRLVLLVVTAPLLFLGARSSLQHRPVNPSSIVFSEDHLLNDLCLSSLYSVAFAVSQIKHEADASEVYGDMPREEVLDEVRRAMVTVEPDAFTSETIPTLHRQVATVAREKPLNLVILLEESLGAQFVAELGGEPVTQFLDTLADDGWWFDRMYATGTRSVRGIEAVVAGFPPTPARATVKLGLSQHGFFTLADLLGRHGYRTQFVYGGESHFDNMKRFLSGNGMQEIVDEDDFEHPTFHGSWGVCDEDIFQKTHELLMAAGDEPLFSLVFSVSNHSPWEYPQGGFELYEPDPATRRNSVRYADHALSTFFEKAREAPYWDDTVFVVVADHDSAVFGASLVPIEHFHIPAVILGPGIEPRRDARIASQMDLGPTLLSLIGVSSEHPMIGRDLTVLPADDPGRAIMQYGANQAYLEGSHAVVLQPHLEPSHYTWSGEELVPAEPVPGLARKALAHALLPSMLYRTRTYRLP